jgi:hypothetical protein
MRKRVKRVYDENGNVTHKICGKCGELKGIDEFYADKSKSDGHVSKCKECVEKYRGENKERIKEQRKKYREENKEQIKEYGKKWYEENKKQIKKYYEENKEQIKEQRKKYREENKEQIKEQGKKYRKENKEQIKEYGKKWYEENKEQRKEYGKKWREENKEYKKKWYEELCDEAITRIKTIVEQDPTRYDYKVGEEIYGVIYLVCCKPINKYYVGQTTVGFENRYSRGFFNDDGHRTKDNLKEDLKRYGEDSFEITEIFKVAHNKEELDDLEVYYIDYFNSYYNGYNETRGNHHAK